MLRRIIYQSKMELDITNPNRIETQTKWKVKPFKLEALEIQTTRKWEVGTRRNWK